MKLKPNAVSSLEKQGKKTLKKEYLLVAVALIIVAIFLIFSGVNTGNKQSAKASESSVDYAEKLESKLEKVLSSIEGVGKVEVIVTVEGSSKEIVLKDVETKIENGVKTTVESIILVGGKPYVTMVENPKVLSVSVVCEGANNLEVKLAVTEIITNSLSVNSDSVRIIKMK